MLEKAIAETRQEARKEAEQREREILKQVEQREREILKQVKELNQEAQNKADERERKLVERLDAQKQLNQDMLLTANKAIERLNERPARMTTAAGGGVQFHAPSHRVIIEGHDCEGR